MPGETPIDEKALDSLAVAPADAPDDRQDAGQDKSIAKRLEKHPGNAEAKLDNALDESMDASDPPAQTQPGSGGPAPSTGFDAQSDTRPAG